MTRVSGGSRWSRSLLVAGVVAAAIVAPSGVRAQRGQPRTAFGTADLAKLKWIQGTWKGSTPNERTFYERYQFVNDSTIEITYFSDSTLTRTTGNGRVYLSVGRIFHTFGPGRWAATHVDDSGIYFVPQANAHNTFSWAVQSPDSWTSTVRMGLSGHDRVTVYQMRRIGKG
jgi:hypothetical protein